MFFFFVFFVPKLTVGMGKETALSLWLFVSTKQLDKSHKREENYSRRKDNWTNTQYRQIHSGVKREWPSIWKDRKKIFFKWIPLDDHAIWIPAMRNPPNFHTITHSCRQKVGTAILAVINYLEPFTITDGGQFICLLTAQYDWRPVSSWYESLQHSAGELKSHGGVFFGENHFISSCLWCLRLLGHGLMLWINAFHASTMQKMTLSHPL